MELGLAENKVAIAARVAEVQRLFVSYAFWDNPGDCVRVISAHAIAVSVPAGRVVWHVRITVGFVDGMRC